jgi:hypothetical protein
VIAGRMLLGWVLSAVAAVPAGAQGQFPRPRSIEISASAIGTGGADFGKRAATLTANDPGAPDYVLFSADTSIGAGAGFEGRLSFDLTRTLALEGAVSWVRQTAVTRVTGDVEGGPDLTASQRLDTYQFEGAALVHVRKLAFGGGRGVPFVLAGAGYLRQADDHGVVTGTGGVFDAGAGVKYLFARRRQGLVRGLGLRVDGRLLVRSGGFDPSGSGRSRATWAATAGLLLAH